MTDTNEPRLPPTPPTGDSGEEPRLGGEPGDPEAEEFPVGLRVGRNPANLGDEVADLGDVVFPDPVLKPAQI